MNKFEILGAPEVNVAIHIVEELEALVLTGKSVQLRPPKGVAENLSSGFTVEPSEVTVKIFGAVNALEAIDAEKIQVFADLGAQDVLGSASGAHKVKLDLEPRLSELGYTIEPAEALLRPPPL